MNTVDESVLVLNKYWVAIHIKPVRDAFCDVASEVAVFVDHEATTDGLPLAEDGSNANTGYRVMHDLESWIKLSEEQKLEHEMGMRPEYHVVHGAKMDIKMPRVMILTTYCEVPELDVKLRRNNVYLRDGGKCQYCGKHLNRDDATLDHVIPKSRSGKHSWDNLVIACFPCNVKKRNRTPKEAGLVLLSKPVKPKWYPLSTKFTQRSPQCWMPFLPHNIKLPVGLMTV